MSTITIPPIHYANAPAIVTFNDFLYLLLAFLMPPFAVWAKRGCCSACCGCCQRELEEGVEIPSGRVVLVQRGSSMDLLVNVLLCLLGWLPGQIHAIWIVYKHRQQVLHPTAFHAPFYRPYASYGGYGAIPEHPHGSWPAPAVYGALQGQERAANIPPRSQPGMLPPSVSGKGYPEPNYGYPASGSTSDGATEKGKKDSKDSKAAKAGSATGQPNENGDQPPPYNPDF